MAILAVVRVVPATRWLRHVVDDEAAGDRAAGLLAAMVRGLPAERAEWGSAMRAELHGVQGGRARWSFSIGCSRAALLMRTRASITAPARGDGGLRALVLMAIAAVLALGAYGLADYPELRSSPGAWMSAGVLVLLALGYALLALTLSRGASRSAAAARRLGLAGGVLVGAAWLLVALPGPFPKGLVVVPLGVALVGPALVAALTAGIFRDARAGAAAALWSGLAGALLAFIIWASTTYAHDGRPYDPQLLRDFRASGSHDLAAYAVGDDLGAALGLLFIVPLVALALGTLASRLSAGPQPPNARPASSPSTVSSVYSDVPDSSSSRPPWTSAP